MRTGLRAVVALQLLTLMDDVLNFSKLEAEDTECMLLTSPVFVGVIPVCREVSSFGSKYKWRNRKVFLLKILLRNHIITLCLHKHIQERLFFVNLYLYDWVSQDI